MQHKPAQLIFLQFLHVICLPQSPAVWGPDSRHFACDAAQNNYCAADLLFEVQHIWLTLAAAALSRDLLECRLIKCTRSGRIRFISKIIIHRRVGFALLFIYGGKKSVLWAVFSRLKLWFTAFGLHPNNRTVRLTFSNVCAHKRTSLCDVTKGTNTSLIPPSKSPSHVCFFSFPSKHLFLQTTKT